MEHNWLGRNAGLNPLVVLKNMDGMPDVVQGLVPYAGIAWLYGPSMSFKSFVAMSMAVAVAKGEDWLGRKTLASTVIYIGAEGGPGLHVRRAALEYASDEAAPYLLIMQERPQLDTTEGMEFLRGALDGMFPNGSDDYRCEAYQQGLNKYSLEALHIDQLEHPEGNNVLVVIDTYSQTAGGDDKANVSGYVKTLRTLADEVGQVYLSFLVIDHATKAGGAYIGSVAKLNDVDSQLEIIRDGKNTTAKVIQRKSKDGRASRAVDVELERYVFPDVFDAYGEPVETLVVVDGDKAAAIADITSGKSSIVLSVLLDGGGDMSEDDLRAAFYAHSSNAEVKRRSAIAAFKRGTEGLVEDGLVARVGDRYVVSGV